MDAMTQAPKTNRIHEIASDAKANPALRKELGSLRGSVVDAAEKNALPKRFKVEPSATRPAMVITDTVTGKCSTVAIYAYGEFRKALSELF
jgi:hypothetical protein